MKPEVDIDPEVVSKASDEETPEYCSCKRRKRQKILEAAARAFANEDYHRVKTDQIAAAAGVGKGTLFRYFSSKEELFISTTVYAVEVASAEVERAVAGLDNPLERLEAAFEELVRFYRANACFFHMMRHHKALHDHQKHKDVHQRQGLLRGKFSEIIEAGQASGHFRAIDAELAGNLLFGMMRTAMRMSHVLPEGSREFSRLVLDLFINGAGAGQTQENIDGDNPKASG